MFCRLITMAIKSKHIKLKRIFFIPVLINALSILILCGFFYRNDLNSKYIVLFSGLAIMAFTDMLCERISVGIIVLLILAGLASASNTPLNTVLEAFGVGLGIFILINITRLGSYATGDVLTAGTIGIYVGIENIIIISIFAIILGMVITYIAARLDGICDKSPVKMYHFAFVPMLFLATVVVHSL